MHVQWIKSKTVLLQNWTQFNSLRPEGVYLKKLKNFQPEESPLMNEYKTINLVYESEITINNLTSSSISTLLSYFQDYFITIFSLLYHS